MRTPQLSARSTVVSPKKSSIRTQRLSLFTEPAAAFHSKYNFSELTNLASVIQDAEMRDRRNTCNTFLKNKELQAYGETSFVKSSALYEIKRDLTFEQLSALKSLSTLDWKKKNLYKKGIMYINELWSDRHYKAVVNSSDLKPKTDMIKIKKKIKLFSEMLKDIDVAYKKIKKFNPKEQMDIINTYFSEASPLLLRPSTSMNQKGSSNPNINNLLYPNKTRENRSHVHASHLNLKNIQSSITNMNLNFPQNLINYEKSIVSCSLEDLLQKLEIFAKLESTEKSQELKSMFKNVMNEKMEGVDVSNEKELQNSRNFRNRMMSHYLHNKHSRIKQSSILNSIQQIHSPQKRKISSDESKHKPSFENIINESKNLNINSNTFDNNNLCKPIGFKRNLSKKKTMQTDEQKRSLKLLELESNKDEDEEDEIYNIYQFTGSTNYQKTLSNDNVVSNPANPNKIKKLSNFGRNFSVAMLSTPKKPESQRKKLESNTKKIINKCENLKDQNFELLRQINLGLKLKEIDKTKEFKSNINRQEKILKDLDKFIENTITKIRPDISKKEQEKVALRKLIRSYYVGYDPDDIEDDF